MFALHFPVIPKHPYWLDFISLSKVFNLWVLWIIRGLSEYSYWWSVYTAWLEKKMGHEFPEASCLWAMARTSVVMIQHSLNHNCLSCFLYVFLFIKYIYVYTYICVCSHTHMHSNTVFVLLGVEVWLCQFNVDIFKTLSWLSIFTRIRNLKSAALENCFWFARGQISA